MRYALGALRHSLAIWPNPVFTNVLLFSGFRTSALGGFRNDKLVLLQRTTDNWQKVPQNLRLACLPASLPWARLRARLAYIPHAICFFKSAIRNPQFEILLYAPCSMPYAPDLLANHHLSSGQVFADLEKGLQTTKIYKHMILLNFFFPTDQFRSLLPILSVEELNFAARAVAKLRFKILKYL